jgi:hypothetical protein
MRHTIPVEFLGALLCAVWSLNKKLTLPTYAVILLLAGHYAYWSWAIGMPGGAAYSGPCSPILGFFSATAWAAYVRRKHLLVEVPLRAGERKSRQR